MTEWDDIIRDTQSRRNDWTGMAQKQATPDPLSQFQAPANLKTFSQYQAETGYENAPISKQQSIYDNFVKTEAPKYANAYNVDQDTVLEQFAQYAPRPKEKTLFGTIKEGFLGGIEQQGAGLGIVRGANAGSIASDIADVNRFQPNQDERLFNQRSSELASNFDKAKGFGGTVSAGLDILGNIVSNPKQALGTIAQSFGSSAPALAAGAAGAFFGGIPGIATYIAGNAASNIQGEAAQKLTQDLTTAGVNISDAGAIQSYLERNPDVISQARDYGLKKGSVTGLVEGIVDAATLGAGKLAGPAIKALGRTGKAATVAGALGAQGIGEGAGAYISPLAVGETPSAGQALTEGIYGAGAGIADVGMIAGALRRDNGITNDSTGNISNATGTVVPTNDIAGAGGIMGVTQQGNATTTASTAATEPVIDLATPAGIDIIAGNIERALAESGATGAIPANGNAAIQAATPQQSENQLGTASSTGIEAARPNEPITNIGALGTGATSGAPKNARARVEPLIQKQNNVTIPTGANLNTQTTNPDGVVGAIISPTATQSTTGVGSTDLSSLINDLAQQDVVSQFGPAAISANAPLNLIQERNQVVTQAPAETQEKAVEPVALEQPVEPLPARRIGEAAQSFISRINPFRRAETENKIRLSQSSRLSNNNSITKVQHSDVRFSLAQGEKPFSGTEEAKTPIGNKTEIEVDGVMRPALNSNGQPIHWSEEGIRNFWRWFGNSKVVDAQGRPLVVYHGTTTDFSEFDKSKIKRAVAGIGFYFTSDKEQRGYSEGEGANVIPVYLAMQNSTNQPYNFRTDPSYDGMIFTFPSNPGRTNYAVREPWQIKSAISNTGAFSPDNPDIRFSTSSVTSNNTAAEVQGAILSSLGVSGVTFKGALPKVNVVQSIGEAGIAGINSQQAGQAQAFYDPATKQVTLIADRIPKGQELGVFLHEIFHKRGQEVLGDKYPELTRRVEKWSGYKTDSVEYQIYQAANSRAEQSGTTGQARQEEMIAYAIEEAVNRGIKIDPKKVANDSSEGFMAYVWRVFSAALKKLVPSYKGKLTGQDLVSIAYGAANLELKESLKAETINPAFTVNSNDKLTTVEKFDKTISGEKSGRLSYAPEFFITRGGNYFREKQTFENDKIKTKYEPVSKSDVEQYLINEYNVRNKEYEKKVAPHNEFVSGLSEYARSKGFDVRVVSPQNSTSRYAYVVTPLGEFKFRIADHPQPKEYDSASNSYMTFGGNDSATGVPNEPASYSFYSSKEINEAKKVIDALSAGIIPERWGLGWSREETEADAKKRSLKQANLGLRDSQQQRNNDAIQIKRPNEEMLFAQNTGKSEGVGLQEMGQRNAESQNFAKKNEQATQASLEEKPFSGTEEAKTPIGNKTEIEVDGVMRPALNSNGQPIHWSEEGIRNFWRWFGNSKVVDAQGRPLVVYHGTGADINKFKDDSTQLGIAKEARARAFFTDDPKLAAVYGRTRRILSIRGKQALKEDLLSDGLEPNQDNIYSNWSPPGISVYPIYLKIDSPFVYDANKANYNDILVDTLPDAFSDVKAIRRGRPEGWAFGREKKRITISRLHELAIDRGFDGVIVKNVIDASPETYLEPTTVFVAEKQSQIKSATGNTGAFSPDNPDIRFSLAPRNYSLSDIENIAKTGKLPEDKRSLQDVQDWLTTKFVDSTRPFDIWARGLPDQGMAAELIRGKNLAGGREADFNKQVMTKFGHDIAVGIGDIVKASKTKGVKLDFGAAKELAGRWLSAVYAPEANAYLMQRDQNELQINLDDLAEIESEFYDLSEAKKQIQGMILSGNTTLKQVDTIRILENRARRLVKKISQSSEINPELEQALFNTEADLNEEKNIIKSTGNTANNREKLLILDRQLNRISKERGIVNAAINRKQDEIAKRAAVINNVAVIDPTQQPLNAGVAGGYNNATAAKVKSDIEAVIDPALLQSVADKVYAMNQWKLQEDLRLGKVTAQIVQKWPQSQKYVPLTGDPRSDDSASDVFGTGSVNQGKDKSMGGRTSSLAQNGIDASFESIGKTAKYHGWVDFKDSLHKAYEGAIAERISNGMTPQQAKADVSETLGINREPETMQRPSDNVIIYRKNGKSWVYNINNEGAMEALRSANKEQIPSALQPIASATRLFARLVTQFMPGFAQINAIRDVWERSENIRTRILPGYESLNMNEIARRSINIAVNPAVLKAISTVVAEGTPAQGILKIDPNNPDSAMLKEFLAEGGGATWGDFLSKDSKDLTQKLQQQTKMPHKAMQWLEVWNNSFELVSSFSIYKALREQGVDSKTAANGVLELMNFRKGGTAMGPIKALYMFAQPIATGGQNLALTLGTKRGRIRFTAYMLTAMALYAMLRSGEDDDELGVNKMDELSNFITERSIPIPLGNGEYFKIPIGFGLPQLAWQHGVNFVKMLLGNQTAGETAAELVKGYVKTIAPVSPSETSIGKHPLVWLAQTFTPQAIKPLINVALDVNFAGSPLTNTKFFKEDKAKALQGRKTTPQEYKDVAEELSKLGFDMYPEQVREIMRGYVLGPAGELIKAMVENPAKETRGKDPVPVAIDRWVAKQDDEELKNRLYYRYREAMNEAAVKQSLGEELSPREQALSRLQLEAKKAEGSVNGKLSAATRAEKKGNKLGANTFRKEAEKLKQDNQVLVLKKWRTLPDD